MESNVKYCVVCGKELNGMQQKFCSASCKQKDFYHNRKNNSSFAQFLRSAKRKLELIEYKGGKCEICGYNKNLSALEFHHINSKDKSFSISVLTSFTLPIESSFITDLNFSYLLTVL